MSNIKENETHYTFHSKIGSVGDSFYYLTHWYKDNYVLITLVQGRRPSEHAEWREYLDGRGIKYELMGNSCLVAPESVEQLFLDEMTFRGGSEIYVCRNKPSPDSVPASNYPPGTIKFGDDVPNRFLEGLKALDALVFMSDGDGVNIAHKAKEEIIYYVREMSL